MKKFIVMAVLALGSVAFADNGGAGYGAEDVIAAGGLTTVVGGGCVATIISNGENTDIVYTGKCNTAPTRSLQPEATQAVYGWVNGKLQIIGFVDPQYGNGNEGGGQ